jgi:hypothetical protein
MHLRLTTAYRSASGQALAWSSTHSALSLRLQGNLVPSPSGHAERRQAFSLYAILWGIFLRNIILLFSTFSMILSCGGEKMVFELTALQEYTIGEPTSVEAPSSNNKFVTVFEDDGETGYFYALDLANTEMPIVDALQIFIVKNISDKHIPSKIQIAWSKDSSISVLFINDYPHAVFNFKNKLGYCRSNFPPPGKGDWSKDGHEWNQENYDKLFPHTP